MTLVSIQVTLRCSRRPLTPATSRCGSMQCGSVLAMILGLLRRQRHQRFTVTGVAAAKLQAIQRGNNARKELAAKAKEGGAAPAVAVARKVDAHAVLRPPRLEDCARRSAA